MNKILFLVLTASCVSAIATPTKAQDPYFNPMGAVQADCNRGDVGACELLQELRDAENGVSPSPSSSSNSPYQERIDEIEQEKRELDRERNCQNYSYSFSDDTCEQ